MGTETQGTRDREPAGLVCRSNGLTLRSLDAEKRSVEVIASSESLDSHDEVVEQKWDFTRFASNPVILWAHNRAPGHNGLPIGKAEEWRIENSKTGPQLVMRIVFATHAFAEEVWGMFRDGFLRAVSVGFRPRDVRLEKRGGDEIFVLSNNELFELSAVPIGSNPDALAKSHDSISHLKDAARMGAREVQPEPASEEKRNEMSDAEKDLKDLRASLEESRGETKAATMEVAALKKSLTEMTTERDAALAISKTHEAKLVELEVDALIGKKIDPAQKADFIELRTLLGEKKFSAHVEKMRDLPTLKSVTGTEKDTENHAKSGGTPKSIAARLEKVGS
jgi:HK97 family phage prohead protease